MDAAQERARCEERLELVEQNLGSTQEQLSARVSEVVRLEKANRRLQLELKNTNEQQGLQNRQIEELEGYLEQLKADLRVAQQRHQAAVEEVRFQSLFLPNTGFQCDFYQRASAV